MPDEYDHDPIAFKHFDSLPLYDLRSIAFEFDIEAGTMTKEELVVACCLKMNGMFRSKRKK
jgi:hypothetical protein